MSEPSRKKDKSLSKSKLEIAHLSSNELKGESEFSFWTLHPDKPAYVDLSILAKGFDPNINNGRGSKNGRKFSGRPELLRQLMPYIRLAWIGYTEATSAGNLSALRKWWCILDEVEAKNSGQPSFFKRVVGVEDLNELHSVTARYQIKQPSTHHSFVRIVNLYLKDLGKPPLYWPAPAPLEKNNDSPEFWEIEKIRHQLKHQWFSALDRWEYADNLAKEHLSLEEAISEKNLHACYRLLADAIGDPNPPLGEVREFLASYELSNLPWPIRDVAFGKFPSAFDIKTAFNLVDRKSVV